VNEVEAVKEKGRCEGDTGPVGEEKYLVTLLEGQD
jgi:hypothetical protein